MGKLARPLMEFTWVCSSKIAYVFSELIRLDHREYGLNYPNWFPPMLAKLVAQVGHLGFLVATRCYK